MQIDEIMRIIDSEKKPIKLWLDDLESDTLYQARNLANLPFCFHHVAIMPDAHTGYGMPIGGVFASLDTVIPNAVGVDIGCGMCAVKTSLKEIDQRVLIDILKEIKMVVPLGFSHHKQKRKWVGFDDAPDLPVVNRELDSARYQLGTLGGGNHFIEVQKDNDNTIWFMVHSGSRNFGYKIAREYHNQAKRICEKRKINLPDKQLSFLELNTAASDDYLAAMNYALSFAAANRSEMVKQIKEVFSAFFPGIRYIREINIHHNYAAFEEHFGKMVLVHRKGATSAKKDEPGIIPGSQGTNSFIVTGKGNQESFSSCSHGAGRRMGRKQAVRELDFKFEKQKLEEKGIIHSLYGLKDLEEASGAYKNINDVMNHQRDLVEIDTKLEPLGVIKG